MPTPIDTSAYRFARNPIVIQNDWDADGATYPYIVHVGDVKVFEGRFSPPLRLNVADVISSEIGFFPEPIYEDDSPLGFVLASRDGFKKITIDLAAGIDESVFIVVPGGISKQNFRRMAELESDIFASRFFNPKANYFLTTRTNGWQIEIRETELTPLYFMLPKNRSYELTVTDPISTKGWSENPGDGIWTLDPERLRRWFFVNHGVVPSVFDVRSDGNFSARIVIVRSEPTRDHCRVKFRNSLGVYEIIDLPGKLKFSPSPSDKDSVYTVYDHRVSDFVNRRSRNVMECPLTIESFVTDRDRVAFVLDMVTSDEVYLLDLSPLQVRVIPSLDEFSFDLRPEKPIEINLTFTLTESDVMLSHQIISGNESVRPRLFSAEFNNRFN
ncbi:MAG: hypothetical protein OSJ46_06290 [Duncaniella sp.]|nr:hypothetical protein [Duncaniella sp.]HBI58910.1 hypothetical protein [Porphyromonadaceae bacterium]